MNSNGSTSANAGQTASSEAKAAEAAHSLDMELEDPGVEFKFDPNEDLKDYNEEDPVLVLKEQ